MEELSRDNGVSRALEFEWQRSLFVWEEKNLISLKEDLEGHIRGNTPDGWVWKPEEGGAFLVKFYYLKLVRLMLEEEV